MMALSFLYTDTAQPGFSGFPSWREIEAEYRAARSALLKLCDEGSSLGSKAKELIATLDEQYSHTKHRVEVSIPLSRSLTAPLPPPINHRKLKGILAYRAWQIEIKGTLSPVVWSGRDTWQHEVAIADSIPKPTHDSHGLYATRIERWRDNGYNDFISGLVDLYGTIVEHSDGVLRAEYARIKMIMITITDDNQLLLMLTSVYENFKLTYPNTPIHIVTPYQKQLIIWREVLISAHLLTGGIY